MRLIKNVHNYLIKYICFKYCLINLNNRVNRMFRKKRRVDDSDRNTWIWEREKNSGKRTNEARTDEAILYYGMPGKMVLLTLSLVF